MLAPPFSKLFSLCFRYGIQPSGWKIANVVPVFKKKARSETKNYRPVSLLSIASKVLEKIINTSIMNFLERENLLSAYQFGFRSGLGAADLLTALNREWLTSINTGGAVRVLAVDIAGAFDKVSHAGVPSQAVIVWCRGQPSEVAHRLPFHQNATGRCWRCYLPTLPSCCWGTPCKEASSAQPFSSSMLMMLQTFCLTACTQPHTLTTRPFILLCHLSRHVQLNVKKFQMGVNNLAHWGATWKIQFEPSKIAGNGNLSSQKTTGPSLQSASMATLSMR